MDWDDLKLVLAICRTGTLSGAARALGVNHSTVFRRINAIEDELEVRLFDRQPRGYVMTEAGEAVQRSAQRIDDQVHDLTRELLGRDLRLEGPLRVTAPEGVAIRVLTPLLGKFCKAHRNIQMDLVTTSDALRLSRREADVAVRVTRKPPQNLIGRRICDFSFAMYASRGYRNQHRDADLEDLDWILTEESFDQLPASLWKKKDRAAAHVALTSNNVMVTIAAAKQGSGVVPLPCFLGDAEKGLMRMTDPLEELTMELWVLTHPDLRNTARVRALMRFLVDELGKLTSAFEGAA
ncbi:MAG TPA: LysR family transcriptional regulator [Gammaproteobacteria bacterium]|nr:LysR family transcriptional regulator [Gammaproteobacteria bacterium]